MSTKGVTVLSNGLFIPFGHALITAIIDSEPRKCSKCHVLTVESKLNGDICDDCTFIKPRKTASKVIKRLRSYRKAA